MKGWGEVREAEIWVESKIHGKFKAGVWRQGRFESDHAFKRSVSNSADEIRKKLRDPRAKVIIMGVD